MRRIWFVLPVLLVLNTFGMVRARAQAGSHAPFTAEIEHTLYKFPTGELKMALTETYVRRADGSYATIRAGKTNTGQSYTVRGVANTTTKEMFTADSLTQSIVTAPFEAAAKAAQKPRTCEMDEPTQFSDILRFRVFKSTSGTTVLGSGDFVYHESWVAPDLDCFALKVITYRKKPDQSAIAVTVQEATRVTRGDPDQSAFEKPSNYTERPPSQVLALRSEVEGKPSLNCSNCR